MGITGANRKILRGCYHIDIEAEELCALITELFTTEYLFLTGNQRFDRDAIPDELKGLTKDRPYWFGRTDIGYLAWQQLADRYGRE